MNKMEFKTVAYSYADVKRDELLDLLDKIFEEYDIWDGINITRGTSGNYFVMTEDFPIKEDA